MAAFQRGRRAGRKFLCSLLVFGFCMARVAALALRLAWGASPRNRANVDLAIAAGVFVSAGILLLFIVNLALALRVLRALRPGVGWAPGARWLWRGLVASVLALLVMSVTCSVHSLFTLDPAARARERDVLLFSGVYLAAVAFLPVVVLLVAVLLPRGAGGYEPEEFGTGRMSTKIGLLLSTSLLLALGAAFRAGINFVPRPLAQPAWYHSKAAFYCFNFGVELVVVYAYAVARFDRRFYVPDGSSGPGDYSGVKKGSGSTAESTAPESGEKERHGDRGYHSEV